MSAVLSKPRLTPDDLLRMPDETAGFDLVDGQLEENPMSVESNLLGGKMFGKIFVWAEGGPGGDVFPQDSLFRCFPFNEGLSRKPDVAYVAPGRITSEQYYEDGYCTVAPDLVVEVLSPGDLAVNVNAKVDDWLEAGTRLVWVVDPETESVHVHSSTGETARIRKTGILTGDPVLPGFALPLTELFRPR